MGKDISLLTQVTSFGSWLDIANINDPVTCIG